MGAVYFYHLTERPIEATLPVLVGKAMEAGWRIEVRGRDRGLLEFLDRQLWLGDGFVPHGLAGGEHDDEQPVLLTEGGDGIGAACVMSVGGAEVSAEEIASAERVCILFDGGNAEAVEHARGQWKRLTDAGAAAQYWAEDGGRWIKKAEKGG